MASHPAAVTAFALSVLLTLSPSAEPKFSDWSAPRNLGPSVNSPAGDAAPAVSKTGLSLYFNSNRPGGAGAGDIWVSRWDATTETWGIPLNLGPVVNSAGIDASPALSRDEHWLFFHSNRSGNMDLWASYREHSHDDFGWQPPLNLGAGVNTPFEETMGGFFENDDSGAPQIFFGSNRPAVGGGVGAFDLYVSERLPDGTFGPATLIPALSSVAADPGMMVSFNGLEAFFASGRPGGIGGQDLWTAARDTVFAPWSAPANLGPVVNTVGIDQRPYLASDRLTLYFASDRDGGHGALDLYVTTRTRH
jgi:hypothetical protein